MRSILLYALPILGLVSSQALVSDAIFAQPNVNSRMKPITTPQEFIIQSDEDQPSQSLPGVTPRAVVPVQTFDVTVIDTPNVNGQSTQFIIYDYSIDRSGGVVDLTLNGRYLKTITLTVSGDVVSLPALKPGGNLLGVIGRIEPPTGPVILGIRFDRMDLLPNEPYEKFMVLDGGEKQNIRLGFPQVQFSKSLYPQSARHVLDAWSNPPRPMSKPIPGKPGNPLKTKPDPKLLTVDRPNKNSRRNQSVKNYKCNTGFNRDEYPPAVFKENGGEAHIKCILEGDNKGSGSAFGKFLDENQYQARPSAKKVTIPDGAVIEFYLAP